MTEEQARYLRSARNVALSRAGLSITIDKTASLSFDDRQKYLYHLCTVILEYPERFAPETVDLARRLLSTRDFSSLDSYSLGDALADFADEFVSQGQKINPLSEQNRSTTLKVITGAILAAVVAYFAVLAFRTSPGRNK